MRHNTAAESFYFIFYLLPLTRYKAKRVTTHCCLEGVGQFEPRFQRKGVVPREYFLVSRKQGTFYYRQCTLHHATCSRFDTIPAWDRQTDGIAIASTALTMRALRRAVKTLDGVRQGVCVDAITGVTRRIQIQIYSRKLLKSSYR